MPSMLLFVFISTLFYKKAHTLYTTEMLVFLIQHNTGGEKASDTFLA